MRKISFSVIIPAHNEEAYLGKCLRAVHAAAASVLPLKTEVIVVANRCTDQTAAVAEAMGARVVHNDEKCIAAVRNAGVRASSGKIIVTCDADSCMTADTLKEVRQLLKSGRYIGGGAKTVFDRMSLGILCSTLYVAAHIVPYWIRSRALLTGGMFWCYRSDFDAVGGFDESCVSLEDLDFAARLKALGDTRGLKYGILRHAYAVTSARKFDRFGDWYLIRDRALTRQLFTGKNREAADKFYYDVR